MADTCRGHRNRQSRGCCPATPPASRNYQQLLSRSWNGMINRCLGPARRRFEPPPISPSGPATTIRPPPGRSDRTRYAVAVRARSRNWRVRPESSWSGATTTRRIPTARCRRKMAPGITGKSRCQYRPGCPRRLLLRQAPSATRAPRRIAKAAAVTSIDVAAIKGARIGGTPPRSPVIGTSRATAL